MTAGDSDAPSGHGEEGSNNGERGDANASVGATNTVGPCATEHATALASAAEKARPDSVQAALAQLLDIQAERALTYSLFDEYVAVVK